VVGTALRRLRRVERRNVGRDSHVTCSSFRPLMRGREHRGAMSLPTQAVPLLNNINIEI
jgi:hypothetical protein